MVWTTPLTAVDGDILSASQYNASVRDNLLETGPAKATGTLGYAVVTGLHSFSFRKPLQAVVDTENTTTSTTYVNLGTPGPSVTVNTGTQALVLFFARFGNDTAGSASLASVEVTGATTIAAFDSWGVVSDGRNGGGASNLPRHMGMHLFTGLTPGSNTFNMVYRSGSATTSRYSNRLILVYPL